MNKDDRVGVGRTGLEQGDPAARLPRSEGQKGQEVVSESDPRGGRTMRRSRFSEEQIIAILREQEGEHPAKAAG
jgi:hypothetical protein